MFKERKFKRYAKEICDKLVQNHVLSSYIFSSNNILILFYDNNKYRLMRVDYHKKYKVLICELMFIISHIRFEQEIKGTPNGTRKK